MATSQQQPDAVAEIKAAYADAGPQRDNDAYTHGMRCLSFLTSRWLTPEQASAAVENIGPYNAFDPENVAELLSEVADADPDALVAVGREGSPVLYVETDNPTQVEVAFSGPYGSGRPDELGEVGPDAVGSARTDLYGDGEDQMDPHNMCAHEAPPVAVGDYADPDPDRSHVRAWWD